jgi:signal transduction histidine kinase
MKNIQQRSRYLAEVFALAGTYIISGVATLSFGSVEHLLTWAWPPSGLALAALLIFGLHLWPGIVLGQLALGCIEKIPFFVSLGLSVGNAIAPLTCAYLLKTKWQLRNSLSRLQDISALLLIGAILSSFLNSTITITSLYFGNQIPSDQLTFYLRSCFLKDAIGILLFSPLLLTWSVPSFLSSKRKSAKRYVEALVLGLLIGLTSLSMFSSYFSRAEIDYMSFLIFPQMIWIALRFGPRGSSLALFVVSVCALSGARFGIGWLSESSFESRLLLAQAFIGTIAITALLLSSAVSERDLNIRIANYARQAVELTHQRSKLLADVSRTLASSLNYRANLTSIAKLLVPQFADDFYIALHSDHSLEIVAGESSTSTDGINETSKYFNHYPMDPNLISVMRTREALLISNMTDEELKKVAINETHLNFLRQFHVCSAIIAPIFYADQIFGIMIASYSRSYRHYNEQDLGMIEDLAYRIAMAIQNSHIYSQAEDSIKMRDTFISIASHELRTPLTPLKMQLRLIRKYLSEINWPSNTSNIFGLKKLLDFSEQHIDRLTRLIEELLDVTRISVGRLQLKVEACDLKSITMNVIESFQQDVLQSKSKVHFESDSNLAGEWDPLRIEQVVVNLFTNALKYGNGSNIDINLKDAGNYVVLSVKDRGIGIAQEDLTRIFNRFERATTQKKISGLGLGLYITQQIVLAHGGRIRAESKPGQGAVFIVELPRKAAVPLFPNSKDISETQEKEEYNKAAGFG